MNHNDKKHNPAESSASGHGKLFRWLDRRADIDKLMKESLNEPVPGGARLAYVFGSGLLFIFISQIITGICLALYYVPSSETAHTSVAYITKQVAAGAFLRSLHYYGSSAMIIVLVLHFLQTFLYGSYKGRRELLWLSGATLSLFVLAMGFTGYLLPWDQKAYFATAVGTNIVGEIPLIGNWLTRLLRGGDTIGTLTISRFYVAHVFLIPAMIFLFIAAHIFLFRKAGAAGPIEENPVEPKMPAEYFYPKQVIMDMAFSLLLMAGLGFLSYFHPEGLGPIANPADTHFLPRPEWYYLPMFEWLKFWEGPQVVFAVVVIPGLLAAGFFLLPFLDRGLERRPWRRPIPVLAVAIVMVGIIYLGMRSEMDDRHDPSTAAQLAIQAQQEKAYSAAPFEPYVESPGGTGPSALPSGPVSPLVAQGRGIFQEHGCSGCHGEVGLGGPVGPNLTGITTRFPEPQLIELLHHPNAAMQAGKMPAVDISADDMKALLAYLAVIGTPSANVQASFGSTTSPAGAGAARGQASAAGSASSAPSAPGSPAPSAAAVAGAQVYLEHGCIGCHGVAGSGGRAPALAPLIASLSDAQLSTLILHPNAKMTNGGMPPFFGSPEQMANLVAYLRSLHAPVHSAAAAAPAAPALQSAVRYPDMGAASAPASSAASAPEAASASPQPMAAAAPSPEVAAMPGRQYFQNLGCVACHGPSGQGTHFAPSLINVGMKFPGDKLPYLLGHPTPKMRAGGMPLVTLKGQEMQQLVDYLRTLKPATVAAAAQAAATHPSAHSPAPAVAGAAQPAAAPHPVWQASALPPLAQQGRRIFQRNRCETCHGVDGLQGTVAAPPLAGTASLLPADTLESLLRHHTTRMQRGGMPLTNMNPTDMKALITFIRAMPSSAQ